MNFKLEKWDVKYIEDIAYYANNEKIANNLRDVFPYPYTLEDAREYISSCLEMKKEDGLCYAILVGGKAIGSIGLFPFTDVYRKTMELGYWLSEEYWSKGIMTRATKLICKEAFEIYDINRICASPFSYNVGSRKVLENSGFILEGVMKKGVYKNNKYYDYCMYALVKE